MTVQTPRQKKASAADKAGTDQQPAVPPPPLSPPSQHNPNLPTHPHHPLGPATLKELLLPGPFLLVVKTRLGQEARSMSLPETTVKILPPKPRVPMRP